MLSKKRHSDNDMEVAWMHNELKQTTVPIYYSEEICAENAIIPMDTHITSYIDPDWWASGRYAYPRQCIDAVIDLLLGRRRKEEIPAAIYDTTLALYETVKEELSYKILTTVIVNKSTGDLIYPVVTNRENQRDYFLLTGPSGSGKTTLARNIIHAYHRRFPDNRVFIITNKDSYKKEPIDDLTYAKKIPRDDWFKTFCVYEPKKLKMPQKVDKARKKIILTFGKDECEEEVVGDDKDEDDEDKDNEVQKVVPQDKMTLDEQLRSYTLRPVKEFENSIIMFDDIENVTPDKLCHMLNETKKAFAQLGRADNVTLLLCNHLHGYKSGREDLNECSHLGVFPSLMSRHHFEYTLTTYLKFSKKVVNDMMGLYSKERWIIIYKNNPRLMLTSSSIQLLKE